MLDLIDNKSMPNSFGWIIGPVGSGKTTVAMQWAERLNTEIQYVSVRKQEVEGEFQEPNELGVALQNLLNASSSGSEAFDIDTIREYFETVVRISSKHPQPVILDDLEFMNRQAMLSMQTMFETILPRLRTQQVLFISRTIDSSVLGAIQSSRALRVVLPPSLAFDASETEDARTMGVFGSASPEDLAHARERSAGWILGMLADLHGHGGRTISPTDFNTSVLNDMLLLQPPPISHAIVASAMLQFTTIEIWEQWFETLNVPQWALPSTLTQIPTVNESEHPRHMEIVPSLRDAIQRFSSLGVTDRRLKELVMIAIKWYVDNDHIETAIDVATTYKLQKDYLAVIKPLAAAYARVDNWSAIKDLVKGVPEDIVHSDSDLHFWMGFALSAELSVSEFIHLHELYGNGTVDSGNDFERGRHELLLGLIARGKGETHTSLKHFESAYNTLPPTAHKERLYAAASAGNAVSHISLNGSQTDWRNKAAFELSYLPAKQRWWHSDAGPVSLGFIASSGQLALSYNLMKAQVESLAKHSPEYAWRYQLNMVCIDIERRDFGSAAAILNSVRPHINNEMRIAMHQIVEARLMVARGDLAAAKNILNHPSSASGDAITGSFRYKMTEARIALESGEPETANLILEMAAWPPDPFPRNFGDPHPSHILALVRSETGRGDEGLSMANEALEESRQRGNRLLEVRSLVVLAHIYHRLGNFSERDQAIQQAVSRNSSGEFQQVFFVLGNDVRQLASSVNAGAGNNSSITRLTSRELEVLRLVSESFSNKQIAEQKFISISTVKNHLASVYMKLGTNNRRDAVAIAKDRNLI